MNNKAHHFWNELQDNNITNWEIISIKIGENKCCCGTPIKNIYIIKNKLTNEEKIIGRFCAEKIGLKLSWKTKADYLGNAFLMCRTQKEQEFVRSFQDKLPKWNQSLIISKPQKKWLEDITKHKWKGKTWSDTK